jgi:HPt (histidine-containing phosphotransfer) domain-containing protein
MTLPLLDHEALDQLRMLERRKPGMLRNVALRYVSESAQKLTALEQALASNDALTSRELAHALKGDSRLLGAELAAQVAERLEYAARDGQLALCVETLPELSSAISRTRGALLELPECQP